MKTSTRIRAGILITLALLIVFSLWNLVSTTSFGGNDFMGYWSATYLLHSGDNPYSYELMKDVQHTQVGSSFDFPIMAWNPPTLFVFLLPLAWLPFLPAKFVWVIINIFVVMTSVILLSRLYIAKEERNMKFAFILFGIGFPAVLAGFYMGQVTFLVFLGLVLSTWFVKTEKWFWAGVTLILTTIKPHMVLLPTLYLMLYMASHHKYQGWLGSILAAIVCLAILLPFRPSLILNILGETAVSHVSWATSTIGGLLSYIGVTETARYLILLFTPLPFFLVRHPEKFNLELSIALLTLITVPTTFFGWSYDQTMLLIPIAQIFGWLAHSKYRVLIISLVIFSLAINYYQRLLLINDVYFVWVPVFWAFIFFLAWRSTTSTPAQYAQLPA